MPPTRFDRPLWLTILCAALVMLAVWGMIDPLLAWYFPRTANGVAPIPPSRLATEFGVWAGVAILGGFLFKPANWARQTFFAYTAAVTVALLTYAPKEDIAPVIAKLVGACLLLALPGAHRYYLGRDPRRPPNTEKEPAALQSQARKGKYDY